MFRQRYQHMMKQRTPDDALVEKVLHAAHEQEKQKFRVARRLVRPTAAVLAACLGVTIAMPALAANVEPIYQVMYAISPSAAQFFMPVHLADENNGIRMEVESAYIHGNIAEAYITMQDLTGDRVDDTMDLNDSYHINLPFDCVLATCDRVGYDEETKTARFYILIQGFGTGNGEKIEGDKITFTLGSFMSHKKVYDNMQIPINLTTVESNAETQEVELRGYASMEDYEDMPDTMQALVPSTPREEFPVEGVDLTGIGYVDGKLHVQIASEPEENVFDGNGFFWLVKEDGTIVECVENFGYRIGDAQWAETADGPGHYDAATRYDEYVFDIPQDEIGEYQLSGKFVTSGTYVEGNWRVTFPLESEQ
ncbi:MAG: hypothetical protein Q4P20_10365 [Eubacteriales bacterium]|nr:hypothetical protein [Eubacteriales bacterium]